MSAERVVYNSGLMPPGSVRVETDWVESYGGEADRIEESFAVSLNARRKWHQLLTAIYWMEAAGVTDPSEQSSLLHQYVADPDVAAAVRKAAADRSLNSGLRKRTDDKIREIYDHQARQEELDEAANRLKEDAEMKDRERAERAYLQATHDLQVAERNYARAKKNAESVRRGGIMLGLLIVAVALFVIIGGGSTFFGPALLGLGGLMAIGPKPTNYQNADSKKAEESLDHARLRSQITSQDYLSSN